jgi:hypothetical protein
VPGLGQCRLDFLQAELELIGIKLLGTAVEAMPLKSVDNRLQALDLGLENLENIKLMGLFEDERAQRVNVIRRSASMSMGTVNQGWKAPSTGNLRYHRAAPTMDAAPVQTLQKRAELRRGQPHHAVLNARPPEAARLSFLAIRHRPVPSHQTSLTRSARFARNT